jgi:hypothetical protein
VSLSGDTAVVGAPEDDDEAVDAGAAYVYTRSGTTWSAPTKITASDGAVDDEFGGHVSLDDNTLLVGASGSVSAPKAGAVYLFNNTGSGWDEELKFAAIDTVADDFFGGAISQSNGTAAITSIHDDNAGGIAAGAAYIFSLDSDATGLRDEPTPTGEDVSVVDIDIFEQVASEVIVAGTTDADFCVAPDIRQIEQANGKERYISRNLALSELSGLGSCQGLLVPEETDTWEDLLSKIDLEIAPWYRSYKGEFDGDMGYWFVIGVVRTSAEYDGPVVVVGFPEEVIDFDGFAGEPECNEDLDMRPLDLGGAVTAFGEFANVESNRMIVETAQCNRSRGMPCVSGQARR